MEMRRLAGGAGAPGAAATVNNDGSSSSRKLTYGPHKLLLQDAKGTQVLAFELVKIPKIAISIPASATPPPPPPPPPSTSLAAAGAGASAGNPAPAQAQQSLQGLQIDDPGMFIGCKLLLKPGTLVRRGIVMLNPDSCVVLGGKVEAWDRKWKAGRKDRLVALVVEGAGAGTGAGAAGAGGG